MKAVMGFKTSKIEYILKELDEIYYKLHLKEPILTKDLLKVWRESRLNDSERTLYDKWSIVNQFSRYMCHCGFICYVPPMPRQKNKIFIPRIFTHNEIQRFFTEADNLRLHSIQPRLCLFSMPMLFRVLYATGMRISEALNLNNEDINFDKGIILIRKSKNQRQRIIPITSSLEQALRQYLQHRDKMRIKDVTLGDKPLFVSHMGNRILKNSAYTWFRKILRLCDIPFVGGRHGPRVHDFRHTFAVHSLMKQVKAGKDIYCLLPIISVFMGHKTLLGTEAYVRLTSEMFPELNMQIGEISSYIFPSLEKIVREYEK
ncbi:MAG: tyrosine-type recombinase/integrase [Rikenellaceae bacterium]